MYLKTFYIRNCVLYIHLKIPQETKFQHYEKESLNNEGEQFYQYQQNEQSLSSQLIVNIKKDHKI